MKDLFEGKYHLSERETLIRRRPLGAISDFVVEQMPEQLGLVRVGEMDISQFTYGTVLLVDQLTEGRINEVMTDPKKRDLAVLDLKMLEAAIVHSKGVAPEKLVFLVDKFSQAANQPKVITYEEIIMINPSTDRRTFTAGKVRESEAGFYEGHRIIEGHLELGINSARQSVGKLKMNGAEAVESAVALVAGVAQDMNFVNGYMEQYRDKFSTTHFAEFRPYLNSHPNRLLSGPSGTFSARMPTLELCIVGDEIAEDYASYLIPNINYFPRDGRDQIYEAISSSLNGDTLLAQCERLGNPDVLTKAIAQLYDTFFDFRAKHQRIVVKHVPGALGEGVKGTAGTDIKNFLSERIKLTKQVIRSIKERK